MKIKALKIILPLLGLLGSGCSKNPVTGRSEIMLISEDQEIQIGTQNYSYMQQAQGGDYVTDPEVQKYVKEVGMRLVRVSDRAYLPYEFVVLNNSVPNAWSLPGGKIAINRGLLQELNNEAELAAVLAHEITHSAARHSAQRMQRALLLESGVTVLSKLLEGNSYESILVNGAGLGGSLIFFKYSRSDELEADYYGIKYMQHAGYDPEAAVDLQRMFLSLSQKSSSGLLASHPPSLERVLANQNTVRKYPAGGEIGEKEYAKKMKRLKEDRPAYLNLDSGYQALLDHNPKKALELAELGLQIEPKEAHLYNLKGKAELALGKEKEAMRSFQEAITLNPHYFDFFLQRGLLFYKQGEVNSSEKDLKKSVSLLPTADAHYTLGEIALKQGRRQEAVQHFEIAEKVSGSTGDAARSALKKMESND